MFRPPSAEGVERGIARAFTTMAEYGTPVIPMVLVEFDRGYKLWVRRAWTEPVGTGRRARALDALAYLRTSVFG